MDTAVDIGRNRQLAGDGFLRLLESVPNHFADTYHTEFTGGMGPVHGSLLYAEFGLHFFGGGVGDVCDDRYGVTCWKQIIMYIHAYEYLYIFRNNVTTHTFMIKYCILHVCALE